MSKATTQLSFADSLNHQNESRDPSPASRASKARTYFGISLGSSRNTSDVEDSASIRSAAPTLGIGEDAESMLGDIVGDHEKSLLRSLGHKFEHGESESMFPPDPDFEGAYDTEFDEIGDMSVDGSNEGQRSILDSGLVCADRLNRSYYAAMARQIEAFSHSFECWEAYLQSAW